MIKEIFYERRGTVNTMKAPKEGKEYLDELDKLTVLLKEKLTPELWELHQQFEQALSLYGMEHAISHYMDGFKIGVLVGIECMQTED